LILTKAPNVDNMGCTAKQMIKIKKVIAIIAWPIVGKLLSGPEPIIAPNNEPANIVINICIN